MRNLQCAGAKEVIRFWINCEIAVITTLNVEVDIEVEGEVIVRPYEIVEVTLDYFDSKIS